MSFGEFWAEHLRPLDLSPSKFSPLWIPRLNKLSRPNISEGQLSVSLGIIGISLDRLFQKVDGSLHLRHSLCVIAALVEAKDAFYIKLVSDRVSRVFIIQTSLLCRIK